MNPRWAVAKNEIKFRVLATTLIPIPSTRPPHLHNDDIFTDYEATTGVKPQLSATSEYERSRAA